MACPATTLAPRTSVTPSGRAAMPSARNTTPGSRTARRGLEVTGAGRREERIDDRPLAGQVHVGHGRAPHPATGTARELARRGWRPADDRGDVVERHAEHVVQHERHALGGSQRIEDDQQRKPDRVAQEGFLLGIDACLGD